jgi:hypothetical protein
MPRVLVCGRSPGIWGGRDRRSRASCAAMPPRVVASWIIGPRRRSGMLNGLLDAQSLQSWCSTRRCEPMCRIGWLAWSWPQAVLRFLDRLCLGKVADMDDARIGVGRHPGALSRLPTGYGSTSLKMRRCASATRQSISRFTCKVVGPCAVSCPPVYVPGGRCGLDSSAIGTLVERTSRFTMLLHLPRMAEHGVGTPVKNGPALAGHGAEAVRDGIAGTIASLPEQLRRSLTWDQGAEMSQHARLKIDTGLDVYFCDPHSPWQRGSNENTNGLLRQYFPKGTDLSAHSKNALQAVALALNTRPRKTLGRKTPAEAFDEYLRLAHTTVATTS